MRGKGGLRDPGDGKETTKRFYHKEDLGSQKRHYTFLKKRWSASGIGREGKGSPRVDFILVAILLGAGRGNRGL